MNKNLFYIISILVIFTSCTKKIEVEDVHKECNFSIFRGIEPDSKTDLFFDKIGEPNEWEDGTDDEGDYHNAVYYFNDSKIKCYWDGIYPEIGMVEYFPYNNVDYRIEDFLKNPSKYDIDDETTKFEIHSNGVWYFTVLLDNKYVKSIQYWNVK